MWNLLKKPFRFLDNLWYKIHRICYWLPVLWKDHWWDWTCLMIILEHKLRYDAKRYRKWSHHLQNAERRAKQIETAAALCKRLHEQKYNVFFSHKWVDDSCEGEVNGQKARFWAGHMDGEWIGDFAGNKWYKYDDYMQGQDLEYLLKILNKHLFEWWD